VPIGGGEGAGPGAHPVIEREATLHDVPAIVAIERATFSDPWSETSIRRLFVHEGACVRVATLDAAVVGYGVVWVVGDEAELANLAVSDAARGRGAGALLLDALLRDVKARGGATVHLEVRESNAAAVGLYTSRGFAASGRRKGYYSAPVEDALLMRRGP
jgi:ribosomal-protein-alanine N-acetyltransferase